MKIPPEEIEIKKLAGTSGDGDPVLYVLSKGGLHAFFTKTKDEVKSLGAAPHRAIATWLAEQHDPKIKWNEEFMAKGEDFVDDLQKSEANKFMQLRKALFAPVPDLPEPRYDYDAYLVYGVREKTFSISSAEEVREGIEKGEIRRYDMVRHASLMWPAHLVEDDPQFGELMRRKCGG